MLENKVYSLECRALGGMPPVSNITVSCGNITASTQSGKIFTSPVTFTRNMTGQHCTCKAHHVTGYYDNNTSTLLQNILFQPSIVSFYIFNTIIENGSFAQFLCETDGNPAPNIYLFKRKEIKAQNSSGYFLFYNKSMSCKDAGNYLCLANNERDFNSVETKEVTLYVKCPLQLTSEENVKNFSLQTGQILSYNFTVYGYPEPDKFTILKSGQVTNNIIVTASLLEPPYTTVHLELARLKSEDFGSYSLVIFQNGLERLFLNFVITEENNLETNINIAAAVGGSIAAFVLLIIFTIAFVVFRKYEITCKKKQIEHSAKETHTYSELSISQQQLDLHNYEAPIINTNLHRTESMETYSNYMNVKGQDNGVSQYEEIDNIKS
ncbi:uncharacterized protein LOC106051146 [Biomphalaria glabrata]|uniref:Uncharacterized protein LOC106051146 n=1 Tax=Biomphalaria glabrata TaxID=6526 RepID=A0A9W2YVZ5_BIOGL|nr:uncharacterized protein LOC106051146 [Biomphalaria glabrata]